MFLKKTKPSWRWDLLVEVEGNESLSKDFLRCLSKASLILFRSVAPPRSSDLDDEPPPPIVIPLRPLYITRLKSQTLLSGERRRDLGFFPPFWFGWSESKRKRRRGKVCSLTLLSHFLYCFVFFSLVYNFFFIIYKWAFLIGL